MDDLRARLDVAPLSRTQVVAIALTAVLNGVDGYDVLSMTFAAPAVSAQWGIGKAALGLTLSSGLVGMALGSFFISPLADKFGRRKVVLATLILMAVGMFMAAVSRSVLELAACRIVTGLGMGALVPINAPLAMEYANAARRRLALGVYCVGYPLGGTLGGFAAAALLTYANWQSVFLLGGTLSSLLLIAAYFWLPEPPIFLLAKRPPNALTRLNDYLERCGLARLPALPEAIAAEPEGSGYGALFSRQQRWKTVIVASANLLFLMTVYYVLSWMPQLVADLGYSAAFATMTSATLSLFGAAGCLSVGMIGARIPLRAMAGVHMLGFMIFTTVFGIGGFGHVLLLSLAGIMGFFLYGGVTSIYGVIVEAFDPTVRATGVGFSMGMGRVAGAISPALAGQLFALGMDRPQVSILISLCALAAATLMFSNGRIIRSSGNDTGAASANLIPAQR